MKKVLILSALLLAGIPALAENTSTETSEPAAPVAPAIAIQTAPAPAQPAATNAVAAPAPAPKFVLLIPEQVDSEWFWYYYSDTAQHIVQLLTFSML